MTELDFFKKKDRCDSLRRDRDRQEGALALLTDQLQKDWNCGSVEQAKALADALRQEIQQLDEDIDEKWAEVLAKCPQLR